MQESFIEWTDYTHNFWSGCKKISEGCKFCYMYRLKEKWGQDPSKVTRLKNPGFYKPFYEKSPKRIFTCSMSDFFIEEADQWRERAWLTIKHTPWHTWTILTKRPERVLECLPEDWGDGYPNVWLGVTVETQKTLHRVETLSAIPAAIRFVSAEPLLEYVDFSAPGKEGASLIDTIDWVIIGGESGNDWGKYRYRPCEVSWMEEMVRDFQENSQAAIFVKQMGTYLAKRGIGALINEKGYVSSPHGSDINAFPQSLRIREYPNIDERRKAA